ncbi:hypothetical protein [Candidatus Albibeggiatoa sp. nov. BB20]
MTPIFQCRFPNIQDMTDLSQQVNTYDGNPAIHAYLITGHVYMGLIWC